MPSRALINSWKNRRRRFSEAVDAFHIRDKGARQKKIEEAHQVPTFTGLRGHRGRANWYAGLKQNALHFRKLIGRSRAELIAGDLTHFEMAGSEFMTPALRARFIIKTNHPLGPAEREKNEALVDALEKFAGEIIRFNAGETARLEQRERRRERRADDY